VRSFRAVRNDGDCLPAPTLTTLHSFHGTDGGNPYAGLVQGTDRNLYGITSTGESAGDGTVFKITPTSKLTTLYSFCSLSRGTSITFRRV